MAHEDVIFGYIEGKPFFGGDFRLLQQRNAEIISSLPEQDEYPSLSRGLFALPDLNNYSVTYRTQAIHFGGSCNGIEFGDVPKWLHKFEQILARLYWDRAEAHFRTDIMGTYRFVWEAEESILQSYLTHGPVLTTRWTHSQFSGNEPMP